jgi:hypothetical protein
MTRSRRSGRCSTKVLPYTNYWHVKNYLRDEDPSTGQVMTFPVPMDFGLINYRAAISQALDLGFQGAFLCEHYGSDAITVIGKTVPTSETSSAT